MSKRKRSAESGDEDEDLPLYPQSALMPGAMMEGYEGEGYPADGGFPPDEGALLASLEAGQRAPFLGQSFDLALRDSADPAKLAVPAPPPPPSHPQPVFYAPPLPPVGGDDWGEPPLKRQNTGAAPIGGPAVGAPPAGQLTPQEKLVGNQYLYLLRQMETRLKALRQRIIQRDLHGLDAQLAQVRYALAVFADEFEGLKSGHFLRPNDFNNLLSLEEFLHTTLLAQLSLYELDYKQLVDPEAHQGEVAVHLAIVSQGNAGPIFKEKQVGPFTLRLLTGATITQIQSGPVQPEIYETQQQRIKRNNQDLENAKQVFRENGTATFTDLKFSSGTFPNLVRIKFHVKIQLVINGQRVTRTIESQPTKPYISMTNTGSQWKDAAGAWFREDCFKDAQEVSIARLWNYFQKHYLMATKQELGNIKRPLTTQDFDYLLRAKFKQGIEKGAISQKDFQKFWDWIGPALKKIRYQKYLLWLFENGYLPCFVTGAEAEEQLATEPPGTFIIRLSERIDGEFVISYAHQTGIRHYLMQPDDTSDKKRTLIDFLGQNPLFTTIMQLQTQPNGKRLYLKHAKDKVLNKYYKKPSKAVAKPAASTSYDTRLPGSEFS